MPRSSKKKRGVSHQNPPPGEFNTEAQSHRGTERRRDCAGNASPARGHLAGDVYLFLPPPREARGVPFLCGSVALCLCVELHCPVDRGPK